MAGTQAESHTHTHTIWATPTSIHGGLLATVLQEKGAYWPYQILAIGMSLSISKWKVRYRVETRMWPLFSHAASAWRDQTLESCFVVPGVSCWQAMNHSPPPHYCSYAHYSRVSSSHALAYCSPKSHDLAGVIT